SPEESELQSAGGIARAVPALGPDPFLVVNGDVWCDLNFRLAFDSAAALTAARAQAWLLLVDNPAHNEKGDFSLDPDGHVVLNPSPPPAQTFSGLGVHSPL